MIKKFIVSGLETLDTWLDNVPTIEHEDGKWWLARYGDWGCRLKLATLSARLDEKWQTGVWFDAFVKEAS